ncbi:MAG: hydratase [Xanthomonadales bacterium]|nr:hydratase [Xanthomonadales bacterium]
MNRALESAAQAVRTFTQEDFDRFARLSGDRNPIHVDPGFASRTDFGRTVAHGLLLCSVLRVLVDRLRPGWGMVEQNVSFRAPTFAEDPMEFRAWLTESDEHGSEVRLEVRRQADGVVTCEGVCRVAP